MLLISSVDHSFLLLYNIILWISHNLFIHSSIDGHWGFFYYLAIMNNAIINPNVNIFVHVFLFSWVDT